MSVKVIYHQGKEIVFVDYTHCKLPEETLEVLEQSESFLLSYRSGALILVDVTGAPGSTEYMARAKAVSQKVNHKVNKRAIVGITGLKKIMFQGYSRIVNGNNRAFNNREEAMAFLVSA